jgi:hypothetical protein
VIVGNSPEAIAALIRSYEEALVDPTFRKDRLRVSALLADDFVEFGSSGNVWTRDQILDRLSNEEFDPPMMEDFECRAISAGVMLATYRAVRTDSKTDSQAVTLRSSLWTNKAGKWLLRFHQGTRAV